MEQGSDQEIQEIKEGMGEELGRALNKSRDVRGRRSSSGIGLQANTLVLGGLGILILAVLVGLYLRGGTQGIPGEGLSEINARFERLEEGLRQTKSPNESIARLEGQIKGLQQSVSKLDKKIDRVQRKVVSVASPGQAQPAVRKKPVTQAGGRYHVVRRGETLYRIAKKYGVSVGDLLRLNDFEQGQTIYPGQKILVTSGEQ